MKKQLFDNPGNSAVTNGDLKSDKVRRASARLSGYDSFHGDNTASNSVGDLN
jgi:hypothetical protein